MHVRFVDQDFLIDVNYLIICGHIQVINHSLVIHVVAHFHRKTTLEDIQ